MLRGVGVEVFRHQGKRGREMKDKPSPLDHLIRCMEDISTSQITGQMLIHLRRGEIEQIHITHTWFKKSTCEEENEKSPRVHRK